MIALSEKFYRICVWSRNLKNEAAWLRFGLFRHRKIVVKRDNILLNVLVLQSSSITFINVQAKQPRNKHQANTNAQH
jgi:hypothetical protein